MADGTVLRRFKRAFIDAIAPTVDNAYYQSPTSPDAINGSDGSRLTAWWTDNADATVSVDVAVGAGQVWFDETSTLTLRIQALGKDTDDDQETCDTRLSETLAAVITILSADPSAGTTDNDDMQVYRAFPVSWTYSGGVLDTQLRAASFDVDIEVHARIQL
jgi:hypothetical protein